MWVPKLYAHLFPKPRKPLLKRLRRRVNSKSKRYRIPPGFPIRLEYGPGVRDRASVLYGRKGPEKAVIKLNSRLKSRPAEKRAAIVHELAEVSWHLHHGHRCNSEGHRRARRLEKEELGTR